MISEILREIETVKETSGRKVSQREREKCSRPEKANRQSVKELEREIEGGGGGGDRRKKRVGSYVEIEGSKGLDGSDGSLRELESLDRPWR